MIQIDNIYQPVNVLVTLHSLGIFVHLLWSSLIAMVDEDD